MIQVWYFSVSTFLQIQLYIYLLFFSDFIILGTQKACEDARKRFASLQNWTLMDCNIKCCTGDDCNTQNVTLLPLEDSTTGPSTAVTTTESHACRHLLWNEVLAIAAGFLATVVFF